MSSWFDCLKNPLRTRRKYLWLFLPLAVTGLGDGVLTLVGNNITGLGWGWEISPTWRWFLHRGAVAFSVAFLGYLVVVGALVACAPLRLAKVLCLTMVLAHTWGIISWLHLTGFSYFLEPLIYGAIAVITAVGVEQAGCTQSRNRVAVSFQTSIGEPER